MAIHLGGFFYHLFIDPLLSRVRHDIADLVPEGASVLEVASGSGAQAVELARRGCNVLGIDMEPEMVDYARRRVPAGCRESLEFRVADARCTDLPDSSMDLAAVTLALHAMPAGSRIPVLREMRRVAPVLVVADYACPLPRSFGGLVAGVIERLAGGEHLAGFRTFQAAGGLKPLLTAAGLKVLDCRESLGGVVEICRVS